MNPVASWILGLMVSVASPDKLAALPQFAGHEETADDKRARYESIAEDLFEVVYDPSVKPLYGGSKGRAMTAATVLAVAFHESGFAHDVDKGPCHQGKKHDRCDGGMSACMMQVRIGEGTTLRGVHGVDGLTQKDLFADRKACLRVGLFMIRKSFTQCMKWGPNAKLNAYASGKCSVGEDKSLEILSIARRFTADREAIPGPDVDLLFTAPPKADVPPVSMLDSKESPE